MITLKELRWNNCFSYKDNNKLVLDSSPITQLIGANGAGKTSIPLILQEVLYGKNIKGIKKQDITNRHSNKNGYSIELDFIKEQDNYRIVLDRKSSLKLKLYKNDEDISSHTSINTYKNIAEIIGVEDFKTFVQLIYQSSTDSLEFLTATDTNRKKFLISLLHLERYVELHELFKKKAKELSDSIREVNGAVNNIRSWIEKHEAMDKTEKTEKEVPRLDAESVDKLAELKSKLNEIRSLNTKINSNNEYKRLLDELDMDLIFTEVPEKQFSSTKLELDLNNAKRGQLHPKSMIDKIKSLGNKCPTCEQLIDTEYQSMLLSNYQHEIDSLKQEEQEILKLLKETREIESLQTKKKKVQQEFERLNLLIDKELPTKPYNKDDLEKQIKELTDKIESVNREITRLSKYNAEVSAHNSKIKVIADQLVEFRDNLQEKLSVLKNTEDLHTIVDLLKSTFSTNGLISYKIESSVKQLERVINEYLAELSHFQIFFKLSGDKLNIEVLDDVGNITGVESLSTGERGRVNIATVLAIRKIMSSLTSTRINFLFLDEIVGTIDDEGKNAICDILLKEDLNTFMVSHDWTHPLISKVHIIKEGKTSRIEDG